jgi:predicted ATPase/class 3 adenylate cyclase
MSTSNPPDTPQFAARPTGTVTFLFSDIEGSTRLWEQYPQAMPQAFARQEILIRQAMAAHGGYVYKMIGDAFQVAFSTASDALSAAIETQRLLAAEPWSGIPQLKVRMGLHTGITEERPDDYVGPDLNRVARIMSAGHGGQILLSQTTGDLVHPHLPPQVELFDHGECLLKDLTHPERIYQVVAPGLPAHFPALKTVDMLQSSLPTQVTAFVGREEELGQIEDMLADPDCRLVTLVGIGGSGKTRLVIQAAGQCHQYAQAVRFVPLETVTSLDGMISAIAQALLLKFQVPDGLVLSPNAARDQLFHHLAERRLLLVLDNFEPLMDQADFLADLLRECKSIKLLVTSRERLNLPGEWVLELLGLPFPDSGQADQAAEFPAVQLFIRSAQRSAQFNPSPEDWPAVARICQLVEGIPLGIEMAATWVKLLSCAEIVEEMERDLDALSASWRGMPERHRTLRAVFEYSWQLLTPQDQDAFVRLSIFSGGFNRQAALQAAGVPLNLLAVLVDKSLLRRMPDVRFEIHPVLRQYAHEKLASNPSLYSETRTQHALYFISWMYREGTRLKGSAQVEALASLRLERNNVLSALHWLVQQRGYDLLKHALPILALFFTMNDQRVHTAELNRILDELLADLEAAGEHEDMRALLLALLRFYKMTDFSGEQLDAYVQRCVSLLPGLPASSLKALALMLNCIGSSGLSGEERLAACQESIAIYEQRDDAWGAAMVQVILGDLYNFTPLDRTLALPTYQSALAVFTRQGNDWGRSLCLSGLALYAFHEKNWKDAYAFARESHAILMRLGNIERLHWLQSILGEIAMDLGLLQEARLYYNENLKFFASAGDDERRVYFTDLVARVEQAIAQQGASS